MVEQTSLEAFELVKRDLGERQIIVYETIKKLEYCTNAMISRHLKLPINCITPRVFELRKMGLVVQSHTSWCPITKHRAKYWKLT